MMGQESFLFTSVEVKINYVVDGRRRTSHCLIKKASEAQTMDQVFPNVMEDKGNYDLTKSI